MPCIGFKGIYSPDSLPVGLLAVLSRDVQRGLHNSCFGCWQLFLLLLLLDIDTSFLVTNPSYYIIPCDLPLLRIPSNQHNFGKPSFLSWDPDTSFNIIKEYKRHLQCEVRVLCNPREQGREREIPPRNHSTWDRALDSNLIDYGAQKVSQIERATTRSACLRGPTAWEWLGLLQLEVLILYFHVRIA